MPIYEFCCNHCNTIFDFLGRTVNTAKRPACPKCKRRLRREVSLFAMGKGGGEEGEGEGEGEFDDLPIDESKMESAMETLASEAENVNEDDPRAAAQLMRKFSSMTGMEFGEGMETALSRLEAGEDPEKVEEEMGDILENEEPFVMGKSGRRGGRRKPPSRDETLYEM